MNVKRMGDDELRSAIEGIKERQDEQSAYGREISEAEGDYLEACQKELARRWGIRLPRLKRPEEGEVL